MQACSVVVIVVVPQNKDLLYKVQVCSVVVVVFKPGLNSLSITKVCVRPAGDRKGLVKPWITQVWVRRLCVHCFQLPLHIV